MSLGILLAAAVASCVPAAENPADLAPAARGLFEAMDRREYAAALALVAPGASYIEDRSGSESTVEELIAQLEGGGDSVSRLQVVGDWTIPGVAVVHSRVDWPADDPDDEQISVLTFEGGCITSIRNFGAR
jgi:hypothetical protein